MSLQYFAINLIDWYCTKIDKTISICEIRNKINSYFLFRLYILYPVKSIHINLLFFLRLMIDKEVIRFLIFDKIIFKHIRIKNNEYQ